MYGLMSTAKPEVDNVELRNKNAEMSNRLITARN